MNHEKMMEECEQLVRMIQYEGQQVSLGPFDVLCAERLYRFAVEQQAHGMRQIATAVINRAKTETTGNIEVSQCLTRLAKFCHDCVVGRGDEATRSRL